MDFYGDKINYIHAKFGDLRKCYNFTDEFLKEYPKFCEEYRKYFFREDSLFTNPLAIVNYIRRFDIPVLGYFNFTDTPAKDWNEVGEYLLEQYVGNDKLYKYDFQDKCTYIIDLDGHKIKEV